MLLLYIALCSVNKRNQRCLDETFKARKTRESTVLCDVCETNERPFTSKQIGTKLSNTEFYTESDLMLW
jgi:hypothetical protein